MKEKLRRIILRFVLYCPTCDESGNLGEPKKCVEDINQATDEIIALFKREPMTVEAVKGRLRCENMLFYDYLGAKISIGKLCEELAKAIVDKFGGE